ncbi:unnamed protein product [Phytophthora lilii]|uniref:Unnamed protein product n=1 Tax=Phytophthora lilii TaxID=2077276 RepID=A0A9W6TH02_9STRA|nr:unnamed protein product [Phytophthora lilii]
MNELTPSHPAPPPPQPSAPQARGLAPYAFSAGAMSATAAANLAAMDRKSSAKYQSHPQQQQALQQVNEYHAGPYAPANYSHLKSPADNRPVANNGGKFDYAPSSHQYSPHPAQQQQSYAAPYGYPSYAQNYTGAGDYQQQPQQQQPQQQQQQQQQQYHGAYAPVGETNPLGMLVSSATNPQAPQDAMPHEPVNIGLKDAGDRKFRQPYGVAATDSFLSSSGGYVHGVERPGNVVQIKTTPSTSHQQPMYQRSNMYGGSAAYYSQQQQMQHQSTQEPSQQHNPLDLVPPSAAMGASFDANGNGGASSSMGRGMNSGVGGMFNAGSRMPQFSHGSGPTLTTRLKDGGVDISSNGAHLPYMPQQQPSAKSLDVTHPTSLYSDVASSTTSMSMVSLGSDGPATVSANANALYPSSLVPPQPQLNSSGDDSCSFSVNYGLGTDNVSASGITQGSVGQGELSLSSGVTINTNTTTNTGNNTVSISPSSVGSSQVTAINNLQMNNNALGARPPPIDTRVGDVRVGATTLSGGKRSATSTRSSSSSGGRVRKNKKLKDCSVPGCDRTVRSRGLCKGHGGGRRCGFAGCGLSDQGGGFCISHGGGKRCQHEGCDNSAQSRGLCKLHGGGSRCTVPNCTKSSQGRGLCRAHGGGRRCMVEGCNKTDRRAGYCVTHGADKKCIIPECSKTGRIDNMCTKHYFERHPAQPPGSVSTTPPPVITVNANTSAARARAERKRAAEEAARNYAVVSSAMLSGSVPAPNAQFDGRAGGAITKTEPF